MTALSRPARPQIVPIVPLEYVAAHSKRVGAMCDLLEAIADDLPQKAKPFWREVTRLCGTVIPQHYDAVTRLLVPALLHRTQGEADCEAVLLRMQADYTHERARLPELTELLREAIGQDSLRLSPDALGYALRSFFEAMRRQIRWETEVLLPLASRRLTAEDLDELATCLAKDADWTEVPATVWEST